MSRTHSSIAGSNRRRRRAINPSGGSAAPACGDRKGAITMLLSRTLELVTRRTPPVWPSRETIAAQARSHAEDLLPFLLGCRHLVGDLVDRGADHPDLGERLGAGRRRHVGAQHLLELRGEHLAVLGAEH